MPRRVQACPAYRHKHSLMFEKGIRGGITQAVKHYAKANNMTQNLPTHGFLWKKAEEFTPEKIDELVKKDMKGYLLGVDVE